MTTALTDYGLPGGVAGLLGFAPSGGGLRATAIPADAYPARAGLTVLRFVRQLVTDKAVDSADRRTAALTVVQGTEQPEPEDVLALMDWSGRDVNPDWPMNWWTLLETTLGDPDAILTAGYLVDAHDFAADSLRCEWGYVINFKDRVIEVYRGLNTRPPRQGRWVGLESDEERETRDQRRTQTGRDYYAIDQVAAFPFDRLPTDEAFLTHLDHLL